MNGHVCFGRCYVTNRHVHLGRCFVASGYATIGWNFCAALDGDIPTACMANGSIRNMKVHSKHTRENVANGLSKLSVHYLVIHFE